MNFESINIIPSLLPGWSCNNLTREQVQSQLQNIYQILYDTYGDNKPTIRQVMSIDEIEKALFYAGAL